MEREKALEIVKKHYSPDGVDDTLRRALETLIPELREREDERIRTALCDIVRDMPYMETELRAHGLTIEQALDYLEKQKINTDGDFARGYDCGYECCLNSHGAEWFEKQKEPHYTKRNALFDKCVENCDPKVMKEVSDEIDEMLGKKQKPILEVFGFKVGDAVRLKDGDGRKHIIKSFEEVEGVHGPNFYHVEFEDNSARDGIYPGEEYPNGYYTQMEKFEEEQKPEHLELKAGHWYICHRAFCCRADHLTVKEGERFQCEKDGIVKGFIIKEPEKYFKECSAPAPMEDEQKEQKPAVTHGETYHVDTLGTQQVIAGKMPQKPAEIDVKALLTADRLASAEMTGRLKERSEILENPERYGLCKPAEWSEEDEKLLDFWLDVIDRNDWRMDEDFCKASREFINRLKSLRPSWKPSEEQMEALKRASTNEYLSAKQFDILVSLYEQLKKL